MPANINVVEPPSVDINMNEFATPPSDLQCQKTMDPRIVEFANKNGYPIVQENGQRRYGPPLNWQGPPPPRGCEVFVGKLPRDMAEDDLVPIFERYGSVFEFRLMMDFSGANRGFAFVTFTTRTAAHRACDELNNFEIRPGRHIGVVPSVDNCRLFMGGIPRNKSREDVKDEISKLTEGVVDVILYPSANDKTKNRGFAFIEYDSHRAATMARRKLIPGRVTLWGSVIAVDWAEPEQEPDEEIMAQVKILYVRNLMLHTTEQHLREAFEIVTGPGSVERVKKLRDYAFVHFATREQALLARDEMNGADLDGAILEVVLAKPPDRSITRYVKNVVKMGSQALPSVGNVHHNIVAAASQLYAANSAQTLTTNLHMPMGSGTGAIPQFGSMNGGNSSAYAGYPFIDPSAGGPSQNSLNSRLPNYRGRGAAGMRSAGFQTSVNNAIRRTRRKYSEQSILNDLLNPMATVQNSNGLYLLPSSPFTQMAVPLSALRPPYSAYVQSPISPLAPNVVHLKSFCQSLEDYCKQNSFSAPIYQQTVTATKDGAGRDVPLYVYKITVPELVNRFGHFQPQSSLPDDTEAREHAAHFAMLTLGVPFNHVLNHAGAGLPQFVYPPLSPQGLVPWLVPDFSALYAPQFQAQPVPASRQATASP